jgi:hypothetical protein
VRHPDASRPFSRNSSETCAIVFRPGETSAAKAAPEGVRNHVGNQMTKESTPLWVWLAVGLLAIGTVAYVTAVFLIEYILGFF